MEKKINTGKEVIIILFLFAITFMSVGFAAYNKILDFSGSVILKPDGKIYISNVTVGQMNGASASPEFTDTGIDFNLSFTTTNQDEDDELYYANFEVTITNDTAYDYIHSVPEYVPRINRESNGKKIDNSYLGYEIIGISTGDTIASNTSKSYQVRITFTNPLKQDTDTFIIDGDFIPSVSEDNTANIIASVDDSVSGDLTGSNQFAHFTINVISTYNFPKNFTLTTDDDGVIIKGADMNSNPNYTIGANQEGEFDFYLKKVDNAEYLSSIKRVNIIINPEGLTPSSAGRVSVLVDQNSFYEDTEAPIISNVTASINNSNGSVHVSWSGRDNVLVDHYVVIAFNNNGTEFKRVTTNSDETEIDVTGLTDNKSYYFTVIGVDSSGNTATASEISSATTSPATASRTTAENYRWVFNVRYNMTNITVPTNGLTVNRGNDYTATIAAKNNYNLPGAITVTMGGQAAQNYSYTRDSGNITVNNVTGDIVISGDAVEQGTICFVEGTKILLGNGQYKNIEDIEYTDLLTVYDHIDGKTTKVYPIWIEKSGMETAKKYEKITFSDGSILKTVGNHALFNADLKRYVDVSDNSEFYVGSKIYKIENEELKTVSVTNIEYINENVKYYNIVSTQYYNVIAEGFLSTDPTSSICNIYGFKENAIYSDNYYKISNGPKLEYENVSGIPYYLYKGLNLQNGLLLLNKGINTDFLTPYLMKNTLPPITKNGERYFIITTSIDDVNQNNIEKHLYKEGDIYKLPESNVIKYFIDTSTKNKYKPGENIEVTNSIYLEAEVK